MNLSRKRSHIAALLLLFVLCAELVVSIRHQSLSWDEGDHIFAGYQGWKTGDYGINPEHPPLVKAIATIPLLCMHLKTPAPKHLPFFKDEAYFDGYDLIFKNGGEPTADKLIFRARMFASVFSFAAAALVYLCTLELFGSAAALFAMALFVFEPNLIAHGAYVTTDMGVTCMIFATVYALYRFRRNPTLARLAVVGASTGIALCVKHSATLLLPIALVLCAVELIRPRDNETRATVLRHYGVAFLSAATIGLFILWTVYRFRYAAHPDGSHMTPSLVDYMASLHGIEPATYQFLARHHILPESWLYGMVDIRIQSVAGQSFPTYILGKVYAHGVPWYFPVAFLIKSTLGFLILLAIAAWAVLARRITGWQRLTFCIVPPLVYLAIAIQTGLNIGARHILPMYPFLAVLIAGAAVALWKQHRAWLPVTCALLLWHATSSLRSAPTYIAYSNEAWGGPAQTHRYLTDSNVDWGQQLRDVSAYLQRNHITNCWFGYFVYPEIDFSVYGIPCHPLPTQDSLWAHRQVDAPTSVTGTVLVSYGTLTGYEFGSSKLSPYQPFTQIKPTAVIDNGVAVYNGTFDTRLAAALGQSTRAQAALIAHDPQAALTAAQSAAATDADSIQAQVALGDSYAALHQNTQAQQAYAAALQRIAQMEPMARHDWQKTIATKQSALK